MANIFSPHLLNILQTQWFTRIFDLSRSWDWVKETSDYTDYTFKITGTLRNLLITIMKEAILQELRFKLHQRGYSKVVK